MALTLQQQQDAMRQLVQEMFVSSNVTANLTTADVLAAVQAFDNDLDATLNQAVTAYGGTTTLLNALLASLPEPFKSTATAQQKALAFAFMVMKRGGVI